MSGDWPPVEWCGAIHPEGTNICDMPRGHSGDHSGPELPTVQIDEPAPSSLPDVESPSVERGQS